MTTEEVEEDEKEQTGRERGGTASGRMVYLVSPRLLTQRPVINTRPVCMEFVVEKGFLQALQFSTSGLYSFSSTTDAILYNLSNIYSSIALVRERTIPTERPPPGRRS